MARDFQNVQFVLPTPERWHLGLIVGLLVAYVIELVLHNAGLPIYPLLAWFTVGIGFQPWQLATHFLVQGTDAVFRVVFSLLMLYFFLPMVERVADRRQLGFAMLAGAVVGTALPFLLDLVGGPLVADSVALGWTPLVYALPALFGIARPDDTILLLFFPVRAKWILWGTLGIALLLVLAQHDLNAWQGVGVWLGVYGWWQLLGPGARRRTLKKKAKNIEKELNIRVIDGGKSKPQGRQGDDWVH